MRSFDKNPKVEASAHASVWWQGFRPFFRRQPVPATGIAGINIHSRRVRLWAILLGVAIFFVTLAGLLIWSSNRAIRDLEQTSLHKVALYQQILFSEIRRHEFLPFALSQNESIMALLNGPLEPRFQDHVNRYLEEVSEKTGAAAVYLLNTDGLTLASSNWRSDKSYVGHNYSFRPYFQDAMRGEAGNYFAIGATTFTPGLFLSYPVKLDDRIGGVVAIKVALDPLEESWAEQPTEKILITDANGVVIAASEPSWRFRTLSPLSPEKRMEFLQSRQFADHELPPLNISKVRWLTTRDDLLRLTTPSWTPPRLRFRDLGLASSYLVTRVPVPDSDWTLHLFAEMSPVRHRVINAMAIVIPAALALALLALYWLEQSLYRLERQRFQAKAKAELEASEAHKWAIIQSARAALVTIDEDGSIESINSTAEDFFGYSAEQVRGCSIKDLLAKEDHPDIDAYLARARQERGGEFSTETKGIKRDGSSFYIDLIISDLYPHQDFRFIVTIHNISKRRAAEEKLHQILDAQEERIRERTAELQSINRQLQHEIVERRRAETVLRDTQSDLIQAGKLAALGQMSAGITHELNQPLAAIRTFSASGSLLLQRGDIVKAEENFMRIQQLTERMAKLTSQLKTFPRKTQGEYLPVSVRKAIQQSLDLLNNLITQAEVEITLSLPENDELVMGDQLRLEQVVINLLSNALDAMADKPVRRLQIDHKTDERHFWLIVADSGGGIRNEVLPNIFDPFFTTKEVGQGLGLGLSIASGIIQEWGGALGVDNKNDGAVFTIKLQRAFKDCVHEV